MSLFDFAFGLSAVILGLGLAELASRFQQLVFAGRRVKWAPEPVLLAAIVFLVILVVWLTSWRDHEIREITVGQVALQVAAILLPYMVAAAVFPHTPTEGPVDLHRYYDANRRVLLGALLVGQVLNWAMGLSRAAPKITAAGDWPHPLVASFPYYSVIPYALLMFIRWRWVNVLGLLFVLAVFLPRAVAARIAV